MSGFHIMPTEKEKGIKDEVVSSAEIRNGNIC